MATYRLSIQFLSRKKGHSAVAGAAYRSGTKLRDERTGEIHDYTRRKKEVIESFVLAPDDTPEWASHRETLWNAAEQRETKSNSQTAREFQLSLPHEVSDRERRELVREWVAENLTSRGIAADVAIHRGENQNYHAHVLSTTRPITRDGWGKKIREFSDKVREYRETWERSVNRSLERSGVQDRVDRRPKIAQYEDAYRRDPLNIPEHLQKAPQAKKGKAVERLMEEGEMDHEMVQRYLRTQEANDQEWDIQTALIRKEVELERESEWVNDALQTLEQNPEKLPELIADMQQKMEPYAEKEREVLLRIGAETSAELEKRERELREKTSEHHDKLDRWRDPKGLWGVLDKTGIANAQKKADEAQKLLTKHSKMLRATSKEITAIRDWMDNHNVDAVDVPTLRERIAEEPMTAEREAYKWREEIFEEVQQAQRERETLAANLHRDPQRSQTREHERHRDRGGR